MKKVRKDTFLKLIFNTQKIYITLPFLFERMKIEKVQKINANLHDKTENVTHIKIYKRH